MIANQEPWAACEGEGWHVTWLPGLLTPLDFTIINGEVILPLVPVPYPEPQTLALVANSFQCLPPLDSVEYDTNPML
jgi:hypothetical protein